MSANTINLTLPNSIIFTTVVEVLKGFCDSITLKFLKDSSPTDEPSNAKSIDTSSNSGLKILELDEQQTVILYVKFNPCEFADFHIDQDTNVGINLDVLHKNLDKYFKNDENLSLTINKDDNKNIIFSRKINDFRTLLYIQQIDTPTDKDIGIPNQNKFSFWTEMDTEIFNKMITRFSKMAEYMQIVCTHTDITFKTCGSPSLEEKYISDKFSDIKINVGDKNKNDSNTVTDHIFEIKPILLLAKCQEISDVMMIGLRQDYPMFIQYLFGERSRVVAGFSPVDPKGIFNHMGKKKPSKNN